MTQSQTVVAVIGGTMGDSAAREGIPEAARRLSHALAEIANVLDTTVSLHCQERGHERACEQATAVLREWGVA